MDSRWTPDGLRLDSSWTPDGLLMDSGWTLHGLLMDSSWTPVGLLVDSGWTPGGLWLDSGWTPMDCRRTPPGVLQYPWLSVKCSDFRGEGLPCKFWASSKWIG